MSEIQSAPSHPVNPLSLQVHPPPHPLLSFLFYLAAGVPFLLLGWDRCQSHPFDSSNLGVRLSFNTIFRFFCGFLLRCCLGALPRPRVQALLAQAVVATGGVKDVGLELGAYGLFTSRRHGGVLTIIASCDHTFSHLIAAIHDKSYQDTV